MWHYKRLPKIQKNDRGPCVELIQTILVQHYGYVLPIDGFFGRTTETFIKEMQLSEKLPISGVVDQFTWARLLIQVKTRPMIFDRELVAISSKVENDSNFVSKLWNTQQVLGFLHKRLFIIICGLFFTSSGFLATQNPQFLFLMETFIQNIEIDE